MTLKRRDFLKSSVAAGACLSISPALKAQNSSPLITKTIPSTGEQIPVIGLGTNEFGDRGGYTNASAEERQPLLEVLKTYTDHGNTLIDTAPAYSGSEKVLGELLSQLGAGDRVFLSTKTFPRHSRMEQHETTLESSRALMNMPTLDMVGIHNGTNWQELLPFLREAKAAGKVRYIGLTSSRTNFHAELAEVMRTEPMDFVQVNYNMLDRNAENEVLPVALERGIAVLGNIPYATGDVFSKVSGVELPEFAREFDCQSWGNFFLKYNVSHPAMTACVPGTTKPHHALDNLQAAMGRLPTAAERKMQEDFIASL